MTEKERLTKALREPMDCGHTLEQHAAALMIVALCEKLHMPLDVMIAACRILSVEEEGHMPTPAERAAAVPVAPLSHE